MISKGCKSIFPIIHQDIWDRYKLHVKSFWTPEEVSLQDDLRDLKTLNDGEKHFIKNVLAFFAGSDGIVLENLAQRFMTDIKVPEATCFYGFQIAIENIHSEYFQADLDYNTYI